MTCDANIKIMPGKNFAFWVLFLAIIVAGAFFRLWNLNDRPMHTDEAVHAQKFGALLEEGAYRYDPHEYHGPTLNYLTLISAAIRGERSYATINETTLRIVPAIFGILLLFSPLLFLNGIGKRGVFLCTTFLAFSPAFVFYSRYYIQEMLLVTFTAYFLGSLWRYLQTEKQLWAILSGLFLGLMYATKETFVFCLVATIGATIFCVVKKNITLKINYRHLAIGLGTTGFVSILFFSSFGTNFHGIIDSIATYAIWLKRAGGESVHIHPWYYYLDLLTWNEDAIVALAGFGICLALIRRFSNVQIRFWGGYTVVLMTIYTVIPYKTPWCLLGFLFSMAMVSGIVLDGLLKKASTYWSKIIMGGLILVFVLVTPLTQSWRLNFQYSSHPTNPYVYAHTSEDIFKMVESIKRIANDSTPMAIVATDDDYWPLPWYLRQFSQVGYWNQPQDSICNAKIILADTPQDPKILATLYSGPKPGEKHLYLPLFNEPLFLRPGVPWQGYVRKELLDDLHNQRETHASPNGQ